MRLRGIRYVFPSDEDAASDMLYIAACIEEHEWNCRSGMMPISNADEWNKIAAAAKARIENG